MWNEIFDGVRQNLIPSTTSLLSILRSFIGLCVVIWHRNKSKNCRFIAEYCWIFDITVSYLIIHTKSENLHPPSHAIEPQRRVKNFCFSILELSELRQWQALIVLVGQGQPWILTGSGSQNYKTPSTWANRIYRPNLPDFSLEKNPVKRGRNSVARAMRHNHRQWSMRFIWLLWFLAWMCPWPRPTWIMHLFTGSRQPTVVSSSLCSCVWWKRISSVELRVASRLWLRQKGRAGGRPAVLAYNFKMMAKQSLFSHANSVLLQVQKTIWHRKNSAKGSNYVLI